MTKKIIENFILPEYCKLSSQPKLIRNLLRKALSGGAELLVDKVKHHKVTLDVDSDTWTIKKLLMWIKDNMLKERPELFVQNGTVRPGILVLINDADWELMGELEYKIEHNDRIVFISTLHGG